MVAHLVGGIAEHQHHLLAAACDALQQQGEAVAAENGERDANGLAAGLGPDIGADLLHGGVVALAAGHHGLGDGHHVLVVRLDAVFTQRVQHGLHSNGHGIVALAENGRAHAPYNSSQRSHIPSSFHSPSIAFCNSLYQA